MSDFPHPSLIWRPTQGNPLEFVDETYPTKTSRMGLTYGENFMILSSTLFCMIHPYDRRIDGRTHGREIAYSALSIYAICCRALKILNYMVTVHQRYRYTDRWTDGRLTIAYNRALHTFANSIRWRADDVEIFDICTTWQIAADYPASVRYHVKCYFST